VLRSGLGRWEVCGDGFMSRLLFHIGCHKTGSTWVQRFVFPSRKLGFARPLTAGWLQSKIVAPHDLDFDADAVRRRILRKLEPTLAEGRVPVLSAERFSGDLDLRLHDSVRIADRLAAMFPDGRVLIVIREQRAMILSTYRQYVNNGGMLSLDAFVQGFDWWWQSPFELGQYAYDRLVAHYHSRFGQENVLVLPYELFRRDGREFVLRIIGFAGARAEPSAVDSLPFGAFLNAGRPAGYVVAKRQVNRFVRHQLSPWAPFGVGSRRGRLMLGLSSRAGRIAPAALNRRLEERMRDTIASAAGDYYRDSNARTSELIGIDLAEYGYDLPPRMATIKSLSSSAREGDRAARAQEGRRG